MQLHNRYFLVPLNMRSNHCGYKTFAFLGSQKWEEVNVAT